MTKIKAGWTEDRFRSELADLMSRHMSETYGDNAKLAAIYEIMGSALGASVAIGCEGDQNAMSLILDGLTQHIFEIAAERQQEMQMLSHIVRRS